MRERRDERNVLAVGKKVLQAITALVGNSSATARHVHGIPHAEELLGEAARWLLSTQAPSPLTEPAAAALPFPALPLAPVIAPSPLYVVDGADDGSDPSFRGFSIEGDTAKRGATTGSTSLPSQELDAGKWRDKLHAIQQQDGHIVANQFSDQRQLSHSAFPSSSSTVSLSTLHTMDALSLPTIERKHMSSAARVSVSQDILPPKGAGAGVGDEVITTAKSRLALEIDNSKLRSEQSAHLQEIAALTAKYSSKINSLEAQIKTETASHEASKLETIKMITKYEGEIMKVSSGLREESTLRIQLQKDIKNATSSHESSIKRLKATAAAELSDLRTKLTNEAAAMETRLMNKIAFLSKELETAKEELQEQAQFVRRPTTFPSPARPKTPADIAAESKLPLNVETDCMKSLSQSLMVELNEEKAIRSKLEARLAR